MHFIAFRDPLLLLAAATSSTPHRSAAVRLVKKWTLCRWQIPRGSAEINKTKLDSSRAPLLPGERERAWLHGAADGRAPSWARRPVWWWWCWCCMWEQEERLCSVLAAALVHLPPSAMPSRPVPASSATTWQHKPTWTRRETEPPDVHTS